MNPFATLGIALILASGVAWSAPRTIDPDWPCQQIKVSQLSVAAFWPGQPIDPATRSNRLQSSRAVVYRGSILSFTIGPQSSARRDEQIDRLEEPLRARLDQAEVCQLLQALRVQHL
jgi:hypothetical protein